MKTFLKQNWWNNLETSPPFLREPPLSTNPHFWAIFSWPPSLSKFQKQDNPPLILGEDYVLKDVLIDLRHTKTSLRSRLPTCAQFVEPWFVYQIYDYCMFHYLVIAGEGGRAGGKEIDAFRWVPHLKP